MKKITLFFGMLVLCGAMLAQTTQSVDMQQFLENQLTPFLKAEGEVFVLDGTAWERPYGEKEYVLTPVMQNIDEYNERIHQFDEPEKGIFKSKFHFITVETNEFRKSLLKTMNIFIPDYVQNTVNVYLPEIDIDNLNQKNVQFTYLHNYGNKQVDVIDKDTKDILATLYSESFEVNEFPDAVFSTSVGAANCGWDDVSCFSHASTYSLWCASNGAACNSACTNYVSDMQANFWTTNYINTTGHIDLWFKFWLEFDLYDIGSNDELKRYYDLGGGSWQLSSTSYTSAHADDEAGWVQRSFFYSGSFSQFAFRFGFYSNGTGNSYGVYIDDIELTGTPSSGIADINMGSQVKIYPNPTNDKLIVDYQKKTNGVIQIFNSLGQSVYTSEILDNNEIDISSFDKGMYFVDIKDNKGNILLSEKIAKE